ncbi:MAG: hypothetical protein QOI59_2644 [Gammaproteobacteria bacterium]|jgi:hypothetical protein|nr:hypothetical protein [Gammaproteobacteria bacterium]
MKNVRILFPERDGIAFMCTGILVLGIGNPHAMHPLLESMQKPEPPVIGRRERPLAPHGREDGSRSKILG